VGTISDINDVKVGLLMPVFNGKQHLNACIDSLLSQTHTNIEIILIDDCSSDGSGTICDSYADERIVVVHLSENRGPSNARNVAMNTTRAEFIVFVDSDDLLDANAVHLLLEAHFRHDVDCVVGGYVSVGGGLGLRQFWSEQILSRKQSVDLLVNCLVKPGGYTILSTVWGKLYRKSIIDRYCIMFDETISIQEDLIFNFDFFRCADDVFCIPSPVYSYRTNRTGQGSRTIQQPLFFKSIIKHIFTIIGDDTSDMPQRRMGHAMISSAIKTMFRMVFYGGFGNLLEIRRSMSRIVKDSDVRDSLQYYSPTSQESRIIPLLLRFHLVSAILLVVLVKFVRVRRAAEK